MRNKKVYYESDYKLTKGETESDLTKYLGGKVAHENLINNIKDVIESYKFMFFLTAFTIVAIIVLAYILVSLINAGEAKLAEQNRNLFEENGVRIDRNSKNSIGSADDKNAINNSVKDLEELN